MKEQESPSPIPNGGNGDVIKSKGTTNRRKLVLIVAASVVIFIIVALGLGLGLGLGLHHNGGSSPSTPTSSPTASPTASPVATNPPLGNPTWRRDPSDYILGMDDWDLNAPPKTREFTFNLSQIQAYPDGVVRNLYAINGKFPGPLIRVNRGDRVVVNVTNNLPEATTIHWHGLYQNGTNWMDGTTGITQCPIPPGRSFVYNFTVEKQYGTYWYHSHKSTQYLDGLLGPFIIHAPEEAQYRQGYDYDQVVILQDYYHNMSEVYLPTYLGSGNENAEPVPDNGLISGTNTFDCSSLSSNSGYTCYQNSSRAVFNVTKNQRYRLRLINASGMATFQFSVDNHTMSVIESDSTMVEPTPSTRLNIAVAERFSVVVTTDQSPGNYWVRATVNTYCFASSNPVLDANVKGILTYTNSEDEPTDQNSVEWPGSDDLTCVDQNATALVPAVAQQAPPADVLYNIQFSFGIGANALDRAFINGTSWTAASTPTLNTIVPALRAGNQTFSKPGVASYGLTDQYIVNIPDYQVVDILLTNFDENAHPFHLHGHKFWVMGTSTDEYFSWDTYGSLNTTNPPQKDTIVVASYGWILLRFINDNPGLWAFHCHIAWHLEAGLMMQFQARDDLMKDWEIPSDVLELCNA